MTLAENGILGGGRAGPGDQGAEFRRSGPGPATVPLPAGLEETIVTGVDEFLRFPAVFAVHLDDVAESTGVLLLRGFVHHLSNELFDGVVGVGGGVGLA